MDRTESLLQPVFQTIYVCYYSKAIIRTVNGTIYPTSTRVAGRYYRSVSTTRSMTDSPASLPKKRSAGRPLDLEADQRILDAAMRVYGKLGWHGYNLNRVAQHAQVGKALLYSRWDNKEDLLVYAFQKLTDSPRLDFDADIRTLLVAEGVARLDSYTGDYGAAVLRLLGEFRALEDETLYQVYERVFRGPSTKLIEELRSRRARGELPADLSATLFLDAVEGAILMHTLLTPRSRIPGLRRGSRELVENIVDQQLLSLSNHRH